ncbi:MAG: DNA-processing protein DprA [Lachnospiraceae bacterium]|nr:DNA-processing protein DprA [Lachnospiraceae bacterium]
MADSYDCWLSCAVNTAEHIEKLLAHFKTAREVFEADEKELRAQDYLNEAELTYLTDPRKERNMEMQNRFVEQNRIRAVRYDEEGYPERFRMLSDRPYCMFYQGTLPEKNLPALAVVGSRRPSIYGEEMTEDFAGALAGAGIVIISGIAMGIDGISHKAALDVGGKTVGILGSGIGVPYPKENWTLYREMCEKGCVMSEYGPGVPPLKYHFPHRNRLISALSDGILVVEAAERSGTLITVDRGLEQGKEIYVIPGRIGDRMSAGCLQLIKQGARLVTDPAEIALDLAEIVNNRLQNETNREDISENSKNCANSIKLSKKSENGNLGLARDEKVVYDLCRLDIRHFDALLQGSGLTVARLSEILYGLQAKGLIRQTVPNYYSVTGFGGYNG